MDALVGMLQDLAAKVPVVALILGILGALVILAQMVVLLTPTKKDDEFLAAVEKNSFGAIALKVLKSFAPYQK